MFNLVEEDNFYLVEIENKKKNANIVDRNFFNELKILLEQIELKKPAGVLFYSKRIDFISGIDLTMFLTAQSKEQVVEILSNIHDLFNRLENLPCPIVAGIPGHCLGIGIEFALSAHHRIAINDPKIKIGFPDIKLGLIPAAGGTQRLPKLIGLINSIELMNSGKMINVVEAQKLGLVQEVVTSVDELIVKAKNWMNHYDPKNKTSLNLEQKDFILVNKKFNENFPATLSLLQAVYLGLPIPFKQALELEKKLFAELFMSAITKNLIRTLFFGVNACNKSAEKNSQPPFKKVGIIGAGTMGKGIAYLCARAGLDVVIKDTTLELANGAKGYVEKQLVNDVQKGSIEIEQAHWILEKIQPTQKDQDFINCDLVIEAVIENLEVKKEVFNIFGSNNKSNRVLASNTSTIPITKLASELKYQEQFIGLHFFSPVEKMPLVEIIIGEKTDQITKERCLSFARLLNKTPIVVGDGPGFFTTRVFMTYLNEGMEALCEGVPPAIIENAALEIGFPLGPLAMADQLGLDLIQQIINQNAVDPIQLQGLKKVVQIVFKEKKRIGKKIGSGFYQYTSSGKYLWPELQSIFKSNNQNVDYENLKLRLLVIQSLEAARCIEEKIIFSSREADVGSILGFAFPSYTGGVISYINNMGIGSFNKTVNEMNQKYGQRFRPCNYLIQMENDGQKFY